MKPDKPAVIVYDFLLVKGGAEAVTLDLCEHLPHLDLGVAFSDQAKFSDAPIAENRFKSLGQFTAIVGWQILKAAWLFRYKGRWLKDYQRVIFSGGSAPLGVVHCQTDAIKLLYCHTPPRFIYDLKAYYLSQGSWIKRALIKVLIAYLQPRYEKAVAQMDLIIANSENVRKRIQKYLGRDALVVYPPCHIDRFDWIEQGDFYLSTARVEAYKRVDVIVEAFMQMPDRKLVVASGGSELNRLKVMASGYDNIRFTGWCPEDELKQLVGTCIATLYMPLDEDFGISPVESMAAGKPVIGVREGGVMETVVDGQTGILCPSEPGPSAVIEAVTKLDQQAAMRMKADCIERAKMFSTDLFIEKMRHLLSLTRSQLTDVACTKPVD